MARSPLAGSGRHRHGDAGDGGPPARPARRGGPRARPHALQPGRRLRDRRLGHADLRAPRILRVGRLARRAADGGASLLPGGDAARARPRPLARRAGGARRGDPGRARRPARARRGQQPRLRDARATADRRLSRPQGQRAGPPLPVADRRGHGHPARALRTRLRADRGGRPGRGPARGRPRGGRRGPAPQADRRRRPDPAVRPERPPPAAGPGSRAGRAARALAGRRRRDRGPGRGLARDPAGASARTRR